MAINEYYIDAGGGSDSSGNGSAGNPWATLYYAFANSTHGTSGVKFWLYGTDALTSGLPTSRTASGNIGDSSEQTPIRLQGWDKLGAGTAYPGIIDGSALSVTVHLILAGTHQHSVEMQDIELINSRVYTGRSALIANCYLHATSANRYGGFYLDSESVVTGCQVDVSRVQSSIYSGIITNCLFKDTYLSSTYNATQSTVYARGSIVHRNIFAMTGNQIAIAADHGVVSNNSILCTDGTATNPAVRCGYYESTSSYLRHTPAIINNIVEGYGTQKAFELTNGNNVLLFAGNAAYNNGTDYELDADLGYPDYRPAVIAVEVDNESLSGSPFAKSGSLTFDNRFTYFNPNNVGNVLAGAYNGGGRLSKGAVQTSPVSVTGGGSDMLTNPGMAGGMRG